MRNYNSNPQCGIYKIWCAENLKIYFGSTTDFVGRKKEHIEELNRGVHVNSILQAAWNKYGNDGFAFEFIEEIEPNNLLNREQFYLDCLFANDNKCRFNINPFAQKPPGVRMCGAANPMFGKKLSKEHRNKLSIANKHPKPYASALATKTNKSRIVGKGYTKRNLHRYEVHIYGVWESYNTESKAIARVKELRGVK